MVDICLIWWYNIACNLIFNLCLCIYYINC